LTKVVPGYATGLPDELTLGYVTWWNIAKPRVTALEVADKIVELELDPTIIPGHPRPGDAFKRACRYSERKGLPIPLSPNKANFLIRSVAQNTREVERHIVLEIVDPSGRKLEYHDCVQLIFNRIDNTLLVRAKSMPSEYKEMIETTLHIFQQEFDDATKYIDAQVLRLMIRDQVRLANGIAVRRQGSVYFVPQHSKNLVMALESLVSWLGGGCQLVWLPLVNTDKQREMVKAAFEEDVHDDATQLMFEMSELISNKKKITTKAWEGYMQRYEHIKNQALDYQELVDMETAKADIELAALDGQLGDFLVSGLIKFKDPE
jgi:hypothetical protein